MKPIEKKREENFEKFFLYAKGFADGYGVKIITPNFTRVSCDGGICSGYFDGQNLVAAKKNPLFKEVFVHEFAHMTQAYDEEGFMSLSLIFGLL